MFPRSAYQFFGRYYQFRLEVVIHLYRRMQTPEGGAAELDAMRDLIADWKKWSTAERVLAAAVTLAMVAVIAIGTVSV
jgi:hypothetical protein